MRLFKIKKNNSIKVSSSTVSLLDPDFCYVPVIKDSEIQVEVGNKVLKDQALLILNNNLVITSPISGIFTGFKEVNTVDGIVNALEIENDFKEKSINKKGYRNDLTSYKYKDLESILNMLYIPYLDDKKEHIELNKKIKYLVINAIDDEPYVANNSVLLNNKLEDLLETVDLLAKIIKLDKVFITVSNYETDLITNLINSIGSYPSIELKLINNTYPLILERYFNYSKKEMQIMNVSSLNALDTVIRSDRVIAEKMITITGDAIKEPKIFILKLGSNIRDIIGSEIKFKPGKSKNKIQIVVNGLMKGSEVTNLDLIVTPDLSSIILNKEELFEEENCLNCGACVRVCPVKNNPHYIKNHPNSKTAKKQIDDCLNCNACTYICPANINFKEILKKGDNNEN